MRKRVLGMSLEWGMEEDDGSGGSGGSGREGLGRLRD